MDFLLDHGVVVFAVNPKAVDRARDRFRVSGAKSDPFDARVLASFVRTEHSHLAPLRPSSEAAQELKGLTRDYTRLVRQQTRLLNQLTATLKAYYPRALEVIDDLKSRWGRDFLRDYPTPMALAALTERRWQRWARDHRLSAERATALWMIIALPQLAVPAHVVRVQTRLVGALLEQLTVALGTVEAYREAITDFFGCMPAAAWARTLPAGRSGTTIPRLYAELGDVRPAVGRRFATFRGMRAPSPSPSAAANRSWCCFGSAATPTCATPCTSSPSSRCTTACGRAPTTTGAADEATDITTRCARWPPSGSRSSSCSGAASSPMTKPTTWRRWPGSISGRRPNGFARCLTTP